MRTKWIAFAIDLEISTVSTLFLSPSKNIGILTTGGRSVGLHGSSFSVEGIVCWADQLGAGRRELLGGAGEASLDGGSESRCSQLLLGETQSNALEGHGEFYRVVERSGEW